MSNRYVDEVGVKEDDQIVALEPNAPLRLVVAQEVLRLMAKNQRKATVVDLGCGRANTTLPIIQAAPLAQYILIDKSEGMMRRARDNVANMKANISFVIDDIMSISSILMNAQPFILISSMTIHNFKEAERRKILASIASVLPEGGSFVWMDKIYPNVSEQEMWEMLQRQNALFDYLPKHLSKKMQKHQVADHKIRMVEAPTINLLKSLGFRAELKARVERDVVILATKQ